MNKPLLIVLLLLLSATTANACIWDRDTLAMERAKFPEVNELIVGYFPRHSPAYYAWRKQQVLAIPIEQRTASDYDDLGASYDKIGEHGKAIQTILDKMQRFPDVGVYESHANLGTFYIHNGELEKGAELIGKAIEINPDAHFGREIYQKLLVEYVIATREYDAGKTQVGQGENDFRDEHPNFARFVFQQQGIEDHYAAREQEADRAIKGVLGMMRFGNFDSPILLEALGDLLVLSSMDTDGPQRLAARAYLKASYSSIGTPKSVLLRDKAKNVMRSQENESLARTEASLKKEIAEGDAYFAKIEADEKAWIAAGKDVDAEFQRVYYQTIALETSKADSKAPLSNYAYVYAILILGLMFIVIIGVVLVIAILMKRLIRKRFLPKPSAAR